MVDLVTIDEAYAHLRIDADSSGSADDPCLNVMIPAISEAVASWLKDPARLYHQATDSEGNALYDSNLDPIPMLDSNGNYLVRDQVRAAVLIELSSQYRYREGEGDNAVPSHEGHGYSLCRAATALLASIRKS